MSIGAAPKRGLANGLILSFWVLAFGFGSHINEWLFYLSH